ARLAGRALIEGRRALLEARSRAERSGDRRLAHESSAQRIDGQNLHPRGMSGELPAVTRVLRERALRQLERAPIMLVVRRGARAGETQRFDDTVTHFGGGLARKGHRDDALRPVDVSKKREE